MEMSSNGGGPLTLVGEEMELLSAKLDGSELAGDDYAADETEFSLSAPPDAPFTLELTTRIHPETNTKLEGLYKSSGNFCTQCEAEGFRRITYFYDRPDVLATYRSTVVGDKAKYPVLLSNGNLIEEGELEGGQHFAVSIPTPYLNVNVNLAFSWFVRVVWLMGRDAT
jgi:aminopeptidase N